MALTLLVSCRPPSPLTADPSPRSAPSNLSRSLSFGFTGTEEFDGSRRLTAVVIPGRRGDWRRNASLFPFLKSKKTKDVGPLKKELLEAIAPLDRGADATQEDQESIDQIAQQLESVNAIKEPLKSGLLNGKWELIYTTSSSVLQRKRPKFLRPNGKIYQAINADTLRAQNMETWPFFNQVTANLVPLNAGRVAVRFDYFKIAGLIPIKAPGRSRGELEITYLDEEMRISRGDKGNLFILKMVDPSYRVPT